MGTLPITEEEKKKQAAQATSAPSTIVQGDAKQAAEPAGGMIGTLRDYADKSAASVGDAYNKGGIPAAIGQGMRSSVGAIPVIAAGYMQDKVRAAEPVASAIRTAVTGDPTPIRELATAPKQTQTPTDTQTRPMAAVSAVDSPAAKPIAQPTPVAAVAQAPKAVSIGDLQPGTGVFKNNRTGVVTSIGNAPSVQPAVQPAGQAVVQRQPGPQQVSVPPVGGGIIARAASDKAIGEYSRLMDSNGGIGAALVARGMLNRAKDLENISASQNSSQTARINTAVSAQEAAGRDAERNANLAQEKKVSDARDQYAALNDTNDPDGKQRQALKSKLEILTGKDGDQYQAIMGKDELGNPTAIGVLDRRSGRITDTAGNPVQAPKQVPPGMKQVGTANGVPVYEDANGKRFTY